MRSLVASSEIGSACPSVHAPFASAGLPGFTGTREMAGDRSIGTMRALLPSVLLLTLG